MVKANNDRLATAVLSMKIKYSQDSLRILKRQLCLLLCQALFSNYSQKYRKSDNSLLNTMQFGKALFFQMGMRLKDDAKLNNNYSPFHLAVCTFIYFIFYFFLWIPILIQSYLGIHL